MWIALGILFVYIIYQLIELNRFAVKRVVFHTENIDGNFVFLSDIHGKTYGKLSKGKSRLVKKIKEMQPEGIVLGGDTVSKEHPEQYDTMIELISRLQEIAPVYYLFGNHETALEVWDEERFGDYVKRLNALGIQIVRNQEFYPCKDQNISGYGMELPISQYKKWTKKPLAPEIIPETKNRWKPCDEKNLRFLFVHQPSYAEEYVKLNVDGIFAGHTHGGLVRIPGLGGLVSTELTLFPKYDGGIYHIGEDKKTKLVVSQGLGTHHFHIRIFDSAQLIYVTISSCKERKN